MKTILAALSLACWLRVGSGLAGQAAPAAVGAHFSFDVTNGLNHSAGPGRLFIVISPSQSPEPRSTLGQTGLDAPTALAKDLTGFAAGANAALDERSFSVPAGALAGLARGEYWAQAVYDHNPDLRSPGSPGNFFSAPVRLSWPAAGKPALKLELTREVPPESLPPETDQLKFIKFESKLLSEFYGRPIFLRVGVALPAGYGEENSRKYPLWIRIGGLNDRYTTVLPQMSPNSRFRQTWMDQKTPRLILIQLDGAGPNGDPYQINSDNNGPYGDAVVKELIPELERRFRTMGTGRARFLSGTSTGGWVALALQIFYPDDFNGAWSFCPDPVDFRALQLVNIYQEDNAYLNQFGFERPSIRTLEGDVILTMRRETEIENLIGRGNSYTHSGEQWGDWNAVFSPRSSDGQPAPIWDPRTGQIDHKVSEYWKRYDLRLVLEKDWVKLQPRLVGKIHIAAGEADDYFLNNAVHLLDEFLAQAKPSINARIAYGPRKRHGWADVSMTQMLGEMESRAEPTRP
jgi:S-formylglutathione hydrolase FrmB